jgi:hypothetical protein
MVRSRSVIMIAGVVMVLAASTFAAAADLTSYRNREGRYEITLQPRYLAFKSVDFDGGTSIDIDSDLGFGKGPRRSGVAAGGESCYNCDSIGRMPRNPMPSRFQNPV